MPAAPLPADPPAPPSAGDADAGLNRLQRAYFRWAEPYYQRLDEPYRSEGRRMDRFLYSRRGLGLWAGLVLAVLGSGWGLRLAGFPWGGALLLSVMVWFSVTLSVGTAWLMPERFTLAQLARRAGWTALFAFVGAVLGFMFGRALRPGGLAPDRLGAELGSAAQRAWPVLLVVAVSLLLLTWAVAQWRRQVAQRQLHLLRLQQERDAAARQMAEGRLKLLQAQIQPHFIFNTLAALQHWVDSGDPRAGPLLRTLTQFLRGSTEMLGRAQTPLEAECAIVAQYLRIMQARLGERLRFQINLAPDCAGLRLPPGLLLTLVENAVEHGIAPALSGGTVTVSASATGSRVSIRVADDGAGLAPGWVEGVGLANCRERLRHHGDGSGDLSLLARPEGGTEAWLDLPGKAP